MLKNWTIPGLFYLVKSFLYNFDTVDDWIQTTDLWCRKQPVYQLRAEPQPLPIHNT